MRLKAVQQKEELPPAVCVFGRRFSSSSSSNNNMKQRSFRNNQNASGGGQRGRGQADADPLDVPLRHQQHLQQQQSQQPQLPQPPAPQPRSFRSRCVSDGVVPDQLQQRSKSPPTYDSPAVGSSSSITARQHGTYGGDGSGSGLAQQQQQQQILRPPPSPGTPPKKAWERQFAGFLRNRNRPKQTSMAPPTLPFGRQRSSGGASDRGGSRSPATISSTSTTASVSVQATEPSSTDSNNTTTVVRPAVTRESSVRGGKFFTNVFRSSASSAAAATSTSGAAVAGEPFSAKSSSRKVKSTDELDGTLRRGVDRACYSPHTQRQQQQQQQQQQQHQRSKSQGTLQQTPTSPFRDYSVIQSKLMMRQGTTEEDQLPGPPLFLAPKTKQQPSTSTTDTTPSSSRRPLDGVSPASSSMMKKAFTDFHNKSEDANSAYLGDNPSHYGHSLLWSQKNEQLSSSLTDSIGQSFRIPNSKSHGEIANAESFVASVTPSSLTMPNHHPRSATSVFDTSGRLRSSDSGGKYYHSPLDPVPEAVKIAKDLRVLKAVAGVEAWQTGRRYLIAPAALAACPVAAVSFLFTTNKHDQVQTAEESALNLNNDNDPPFGMIVLGECLLNCVATTDSTIPSTDRTVKRWSAAKLVLRQNYLLEYDSDETDFKGAPRGYAHLQGATTKLHEHFDDTLELHFYGSPCAKSDARTLIIRIVSAKLSSSQLAAAAAAASSSSSSSKTTRKINPLDDSHHYRTSLRQAWRVCLNRAASLCQISDLYQDYDDQLLGSSMYAQVHKAKRRNSDTVCALKIFDKNKFWSMVVKGRERADTIVREASVQATLWARCGKIPSFLKIQGFFETSDHVVLELEILEGTDLFQYISSRKVLSESEAARIMYDVLRCLEGMNRVGIAHRDIKPANILMCSGKQNGPRVKVGDFGMSTFVGVDGHVRGRCGTPGYVAPEIFTAGIYGGYGNKVDIFSAGATLYVMLCGYEPFYGETDEELKDANKAAEVDFPAEDWNGVSSEAKDLVQRMMQADPSKRLDARASLEHPWFAKHLGKVDELDQSTSLPSSEAMRSDSTCVIA